MRIFTLISIVFVVSSCAFASTSIGSLHNYQNDRMGVVCKLKKTKVSTVSEEDRKTFAIKSDKRTYVYADIEFTNLSDKARLINPKNYYLSVNDENSDVMWVDSSIDYIIREKELQPNETIKMSVYWAFDGELSQEDIKKLKLIYQQQ